MIFQQHFSDFLHFSILTAKVIADVSLQLEPEAFSIGGYIVLTCTVNGMKTIDKEETRQWSKGYDDELLSYNGRINNPSKYGEKVHGNRFSLKIFNVTEKDLNAVYQCRYGFDAAYEFIKKYKDDSVLSLTLVTNVIVFGESLILTCTVNGTSTIDREVTRQWSLGNDDQLLSYNGRIKNLEKYEETVSSNNEFSLKIFNLTEEDVEEFYLCRYGFDTATKFIEITEDNYIYPPTPTSTTVGYFFETQMETINISVHFQKVFPVPNCSTNVDAATFDVTDFYGDERTMEVNLSLSLQKKVTCNRIITMSCDIAGIKYDVGTLAIKDKCSFKGNFGTKVILSITLIPSVILVLITVLALAKHSLVSEERTNPRKETTNKNQSLSNDMPEYEPLCRFSEGEYISTIVNGVVEAAV
ncbi:uncharacterized protein LOC143058915 isoform X2 [Mytilus galloprovincialis]|uniref:uncharacterized protein LOC143058915 isoform X2 n=1 Tax=Mytilus galloprovincialis TaxID=29158 RepID=UPI003F7CA3FB